MRRRVNEEVIIRELTEEERLQNAGIPPGGNDEEEEGDLLQTEDEVPFTVQMRKETRKVHSVSDALVNAKLGIAMSDEKVWAEGLLVFYEVFKFLEESLDRLSPKISHFKKMAACIGEISRSSAFRADLEYYYGSNYLKSYQPRPSVTGYLKHLQTLEEREPLRLLAYVYHLYMGLLSGGQILNRKRELRRKLARKFNQILNWFHLADASTSGGGSSSSSSQGCAVTSFAIQGRTIADIKKDIAWTMNDIASDLSKDEKASLLEESLIVFQRNNEIVASIQRTGLIALKNLTGSPFIWALAAITFGAILAWFYYSSAVAPPIDVLQEILPVPESVPESPQEALDPLESAADGFLD